jgi:hypothetical protein
MVDIIYRVHGVYLALIYLDLHCRIRLVLKLSAAYS